MSEQRWGEDPIVREALVGATRRLLGIRPVRVVLGLGLVVVGVHAFGAATLWLATRPGACEEVPHVDLSMDEMVAVKRRIDRYERDPSAPLALNGREASFLLADNLLYPVLVDVSGDELEARLSLPEPGTDRCYAVDFRGTVAVHDGVAEVHPSKLVVGRVDLAKWLPHLPVRVGAEDLSGEHASALLGSTQELEVVDGQLRVRITDLEEFH